MERDAMADPLHALLHVAFEDWVKGEASFALLEYLARSVYRMGAHGPNVHATHTILLEFEFDPTKSADHHR